MAAIAPAYMLQSLPLIEAEASTSRTYPTQEQDVEMKERDGSGGSSGSDKEA